MCPLSPFRQLRQIVSNLLTDFRTMTPPSSPSAVSAHPILLTLHPIKSITTQFWRSVVGASTDKAPSSPFSGPLDSQTLCFEVDYVSRRHISFICALEIRAQGFLRVLSVPRPCSKIKFETSNVIPSVISLTALVMRNLSRALSLVSRSRGVVAFGVVGRNNNFRRLSS